MVAFDNHKTHVNRPLINIPQLYIVIRLWERFRFLSLDKIIKLGYFVQDIVLIRFFDAGRGNRC